MDAPADIARHAALDARMVKAARGIKLLSLASWPAPVQVEFLERWRRIEVQLPPGASLPALPNIVERVSDGQFHLLTTNGFDERQLALLGPAVRNVQRMSLEEIFVANVMHHRESDSR